MQILEKLRDYSGNGIRVHSMRGGYKNRNYYKNRAIDHYFKRALAAQSSTSLSARPRFHLRGACLGLSLDDLHFSQLHMLCVWLRIPGSPEMVKIRRTGYFPIGSLLQPCLEVLSGTKIDQVGGTLDIDSRADSR